MHTANDGGAGPLDLMLMDIEMSVEQKSARPVNILISAGALRLGKNNAPVSAESVLPAVDDAPYRAKSGGRNQSMLAYFLGCGLPLPKKHKFRVKLNADISKGAWVSLSM